MTRRALVLGGGGITGIAWMWGILAGLAAKEIDLSDADLIIGTSAGSVVGASLAAGLTIEDRYQAQLAPPTGEVAASLGKGLMLRFGLAMLGTRNAERVRARIGRLALRAHTVPERERLDVIESRLPVRDWPDRALKLTAVDTSTGAFQVFDRTSGATLVEAVAASCAVPGVWPPVTIDGHRYMDGGVRSATNADLATGYDRVVVLAPLPRGFGPIPSAVSQVATLRETAHVTLITPDRATLTAIGSNVLDPAARAPSARAGLTQSAAVLADIRATWD